MKIYYIDGNNLIGKIPDLKNKLNSDKTFVREQLVFLLEKVFLNTNNRAILFFDGFMNGLIKSNKLQIIYSDARAADFVIKEEIDRSKNPRNIVVVSSDNEVYDYGKKSYCDALKSEEFYTRFFGTAGEKEESEKISLLEKQNDEFKKLFGL